MDYNFKTSAFPSITWHSVPHPRDAGCVLQNRLRPARKKKITSLRKRVITSFGHAYNSTFKTEIAH